MMPTTDSENQLVMNHHERNEKTARTNSGVSIVAIINTGCCVVVGAAAVGGAAALALSATGANHDEPSDVRATSAEPYSPITLHQPVGLW